MRKLLAGTALLLVLGGAWLAARHLYRGPGPLETGRAILVPHGNTASIAAALRRDGVIAHARLFRLAALLTAWQGPLRAGEFRVPAHIGLEALLDTLRTARPVQHRLTIPEGTPAADIATALAREPALAGDVEVPEEGRIFPETYAFERGDTAASLILRAETAATRALTREWADRAPGLPLATQEDARTLASVVERETPLAAERPLVAAVFLNRLRARQKLQSDPTAIFALTGGRLVLPRPLTRADLEIANPYNTYWAPGLPPGPICAPGLASLHAVLHPAGTRALYFVADGTGGHAFADTLAEHEANIARLRAHRP